MKVAHKYRGGLRKDSVATLSTAGVLGETFVDISNKTAKGPEAQNGDALKTQEAAGHPGRDPRQPAARCRTWTSWCGAWTASSPPSSAARAPSAR